MTNLNYLNQNHRSYGLRDFADEPSSISVNAFLKICVIQSSVQICDSDNE